VVVVAWSDLTEAEQRTLLWLYKKRGGRLDVTALRPLERRGLLIVEDSPGHCDVELRRAGRDLARQNTVAVNR
jgi:hypothetical protein